MKSRNSLTNYVVIAFIAMGSFGQQAWAFSTGQSSDDETQTPVTTPAAPPVAAPPVAAPVAQAAPAAPILVPVRAVETAATAPVKKDGGGLSASDELTSQEITDNVFSFGVAVVPNRSATLRGMIYDQCYNFFEISSRNNGKGQLAFVIADQGGKGRACVQQMKQSGAICGRTASCSPISSKSGSRMDFSNAGDVDIGLMHRNLDQDPTDPDQHFETLPNIGNIHHDSRTTLISRAQEKATEAQQKRVDNAYSQFTNCRHDMDEINIAEHALEVYGALKHLTRSEIDQKQKELVRAKLKILSNKIAKLNVKKLDSDELGDLRAQIKEFGDENPDFSESVAKLDFDLAQKIVMQKNAPSAAYDLASEILGDAQDLDGLSDESISRLQGYQSKLAVGKVTAMAIDGNTDAFTFLPGYMSLMNQMQQDLQSNCANINMMSMSEACVTARNNFVQARNIPNMMYQAQQQKAQMQMQIQQSLMSPAGLQSPMQPNMMMQNAGFNPGVNALLNPAFSNPMMGMQGQQRFF